MSVLASELTSVTTLFVCPEFMLACVNPALVCLASLLTSTTLSVLLTHYRARVVYPPESGSASPVSGCLLCESKSNGNAVGQRLPTATTSSCACRNWNWPHFWTSWCLRNRISCRQAVMVMQWKATCFCCGDLHVEPSIGWEESTIVK